MNGWVDETRHMSRGDERHIYGELLATPTARRLNGSININKPFVEIILTGTGNGAGGRRWRYSTRSSNKGWEPMPESIRTTEEARAWANTRIRHYALDITLS